MRARRTAILFVLGVQVAGVLIPGSAARARDLPPSEWVIGPQRRVVLLTFDGKAGSKALTRVLGDLEAGHAQASFFLPGKYVRRHRDRARAILGAGHKLANAGWDNSKFTQMSDAAIRESIRRAQDALRRVKVYPRPYLRVPGGARDAGVLRVAGSMGYRSVRWTIHPRGGRVKAVAGRVVRTAQAGSIVALDLWRARHRAAVPRIIEGLQRRGFDLSTIDPLQRVHAVRWDVTLRAGSQGPEVRYLNKALEDITYPVRRVDDSFGYDTLQSVYAFEKVKRLARDGVVTPQQMTDIAVAQRPVKPDRERKNFIDIDISRQVLFEVRKNRVAHTIPVSSGNEQYYTDDDGDRHKAHTPRGTYTVERKIEGRRESDLGVLWWPNYFVGGYAIHGSDSVPTYPASHGCVRIPRYVEKKFFRRNPIGRPVFVHD